VIIAVVAEVCIVALLLLNHIKDFLFIHPWLQAFLAAIPGIAVAILAGFELQHSGEANDLRIEANDLRNRANALQEALDTERNEHLQKIAANTQRPPSEAENNARILRKYIGRHALVTEAGNSWGSMGAVVAEVNENSILTLFVAAGYNSSSAWGQQVRCDRLQVVEVPTAGCALQISIIERYGTHTTYGEARSWDERHVQPTHAGIKRGDNVFSAQYRKEGSPKLRNIYVYASTDGSPNYTMVSRRSADPSAAPSMERGNVSSVCPKSRPENGATRR
jgi:hypothetical protein